MSMIFNPGDILYSQRKIDSDQLNSFDLNIIGRVLKHDVDTYKIIFDVVIINGVIRTGLFEVPVYGFHLADPELAESFNKHIRAYTRNQDKAFVDFVDLFSKASVETKYKIMDYILMAEIKDGNNVR